jgi:hypothetical protein
MLAVLQTMADQVAVAIDNAHLFAESQRALEAEQQAYGQISRQAWTRLIESAAVKGYRCEDVGVVPASGELSWLSQQAVAERRVVVSEPASSTGEDGNGLGKEAAGDDASPGEPEPSVAPPGAGGEGAMVEVAIPVTVRDQVLGVLRFRKEEGDRTPWSREQIALIEGMAEQLGQALESARLYQDTQRRAAQERLVAEVTARMRETLDMEMVLKTTADEMFRVLNLDEITVRLVPEDGSGDRVRSSFDYGQ